MSKLSNFDFLKDFDKELYNLGNRIEKAVKISPSAVKSDATPFLEHILKQLLAQIGVKYNSNKGFYSQLDAVYRAGKINYGYKQRIYSAYMLRNKIHDDYDEIEKNEIYVALNIHEKLFYIAKKFYRDFNENYDEYKGVPTFKPIELDTSDEEIELVKIPDFSEIIDIKYDYCVICGEPNHSNYSLCCPKCNRVMDNANNFISIRNTFGKDAKFTKEDLIEYGIAEGYANQLINSLVQENMFKVAGRYITFNNMYIEDYLLKIDNYISVCELITKFREDKITPSQIKQTKEYKLGSFHQEPFYQFYKIINHEIVNKFEFDLLNTEDISDSMEYTTITQKELKRWYDIQLGNYNRGNVNESFVVFNNLLMEDYIELKREGVFEKDIQKQLNITPEIYDLFSRIDEGFEDEINQIKKDLIIKALNENKTRDEVLQIAGVTSKEYDDIVRYSRFKGDEFSQKHNLEVEARKERLIEFLKTNDLKTACELAKISVDTFNEWYEEDMASEFYTNSTRVLMHNFLNQRRKEKTKLEAAKAIGIDCKFVKHWFNRTLDICEDFKNRHVKVTADLILDGFKKGKSKKDISKVADINVNRINTYLMLGKRGYGTYKLLYDYYEEHIVPKELSKFVNAIRNKSFKKSLEFAELSEEEFNIYFELGKNGDAKYAEFYQDLYDVKLNIFLRNVKKGKGMSKALHNSYLTEDELNECYELGRDGDERFSEFYDKFYQFKLNSYIKDINRGKSKDVALKNALLTEDELQEDIDEIILNKNMKMAIRALANDATTKQAAKSAGIETDVIYEWYLKGKRGEDKFKEFSEFYYKCYIAIGSVMAQSLINNGMPLKLIIKKSKGTFTREDYNFWSKNGFLVEANEKLKEVEDSEELVDELVNEGKKYLDDNKDYLEQFIG